jgi:hypothetical protein
MGIENKDVQRSKINVGVAVCLKEVSEKAAVDRGLLEPLFVCPWVFHLIMRVCASLKTGTMDPPKKGLGKALNWNN